jgi:hypothetical protein
VQKGAGTMKQKARAPKRQLKHTTSKTTLLDLCVIKDSTFGTVQGLVRNNGFVVMPVKGKRPFMPGFDKFWLSPPSESRVLPWVKKYGDQNVGLCLGEIVAVDIDIDDARRVDEVIELISYHLGRSAFLRLGRVPRCALLYRLSRLEAECLRIGWSVGSETTGRVELLGAGRQLVVYGMHPTALVPYEWPKSSPLNAKSEDVPCVAFTDLDRLKTKITQFMSPEVAGLPPAAEYIQQRQLWNLEYLPEKGERDRFLFWYARERAAELATLDDLSHAVAMKNAAFPHPLSEAQAKAKAVSAFKLKEVSVVE